MEEHQLQQLAGLIKTWGLQLGFQKTGISSIDLGVAEAHLHRWLEKGYHGEMDYMSRHGLKRSRPQLLVENTQTIIACRMDYLPEEARPAETLLQQPAQAFVSRYALGRDYHKLLRKRLQQLAERINTWLADEGLVKPGQRVFVDSAPVLEKAIASNAGLGWIGKHTNLIDRDAGSWFFLGEIYTSLPLPVDEPLSEHCGDCTACIDICPTRAIVAPYQLDARRCISYLTIELHGAIPEKLRPLMGNRIYGCDDCQQVCPWNRFARYSQEQDFLPRNGLDQATLLQLWQWDKSTFLKNTEGSAIRRIGYHRWLRNLAVALGNCSQSSGAQPVQPVIQALQEKRRQCTDDMVNEHIDWAIQQLTTSSEDAHGSRPAR